MYVKKLILLSILPTILFGCSKDDEDVGKDIDLGIEDVSTNIQTQNIVGSKDDIEGSEVTNKDVSDETDKISDEKNNSTSKDVTRDVENFTGVVISKEDLIRNDAVNKAKEYNNKGIYSKIGLKQKLLGLGYSEEDSLFAVNSLNGDWKGNALLMAKEYLTYSSLSRESLKYQLTELGFTDKEIQYATINLNVDWYSEALKRMEEYINYGFETKEELIDILNNEGFTEDEINTALIKLNI